MKEYQRLHPIIQNWIFKQGWEDLRFIQKKAIEPILAQDSDILISASTAAGKSEAFFLPACTAIADIKNSFGILYISPLKALINDQYRRFEELCNDLDIGLVSWHGDSSPSKKRFFEKKPSGIILITPESLESLLMRRMGWVKQAFSSLQYVVIDEFHAFIGSERGVQLISLLNRLEILLERTDRPIPRVALSATLGDIQTIPQILRPNKSINCEVIEGDQSYSVIQMQLRGYIEPYEPAIEIDIETESVEDGMVHNDRKSAMEMIQNDLYRLCRGGSHLVFANSRQRTEELAAGLKDESEKNLVPNEFFPHHGSLSKELRETLEERLQKEQLPTTAICSMTLELGIDIGKVNSVIQVTPPYAVSSLRQRLGRSGRRGNPSVLRMMIPENEISKDSDLIDDLRLQTVLSIALIHLLVKDRWFEPPVHQSYHFSTLLHQILAITAQYGGVRANQLYLILCQNGGPFTNISSIQFAQLLRKMGELDFIVQLGSGELTLGLNGERLTGNYQFYAVFTTPEEFEIVFGSKRLGTLPIDYPLVEEQQIVFGGQYWRVLQIDAEKKTIYVENARKGNAPKFGGTSLNIHDRVRQKMFEIYCRGNDAIKMGTYEISFLNAIAKKSFLEGIDTFNRSSLKNNKIIQKGRNVSIFMWLGDRAVFTLSMLLMRQGLDANTYLGVIEVLNMNIEKTVEILEKISRLDITDEELAQSVPNKFIEKYDSYLPEELLIQDYGKRMFEVSIVQEWLKKYFRKN